MPIYHSPLEIIKTLDISIHIVDLIKGCRNFFRLFLYLNLKLLEFFKGFKLITSEVYPFEPRKIVSKSDEVRAASFSLRGIVI